MVELTYINKLKAIWQIAQSAIGKTIKQIVQEAGGDLQSNDKDKGSIGNLIQNFLFKIPQNNISGPDFEDLNIELKVIPLLIRPAKNELCPKERMVLGMINYNKIVSEDFETSTFLKKNRLLLVMTYIHDYNKNKEDFQINDAFLYDVNDDEFLSEIKNDWVIIQDIINKGEAHLLSEKFNKILGACTKGANKEQTTSQPNSTIMAKTRAYSYKASFVKKIIKNSEQKNLEHFISNLDKKNYVKKRDSELEICDFLNSIIGLELEKTSKAKNWHHIAFKNFVKSKNLDMFNEMYENPFLKISHKLSSNGTIQEQINTNVDLNPLEIINESFENSSLYNEVIDKKYFIILIDKKTNKFEKYLKFEFNEAQIKNCSIAFEKIKKEIKNRLEMKNQSKATLSLKESENLTIHVRPHAKNGSVTYKSKNMLIDSTICEWWINKKELK